MKAASSIWECRWDKYYVTVTTHYYQCLQDLKMDRAWRNSLQKALIPKHFSSEKSHTLIINKKGGHKHLALTALLPFFPQIQHAEMGRKNGRTSITKTLIQSFPGCRENFPAKRRPQILFDKPSLPSCASRTHTLLLQTVHAVGVCMHTYIHMKTWGTSSLWLSSVTYDWSTVSYICWTRCTCMYFNALCPPQKKA